MSDDTPSTEATSAPKRPTVVSSLQVVHLVGGQALVGAVEQPVINGAVHPTIAVMRMPYEVFILPPESGQESTITLIKLGTMLGTMPQMGIDYADLTGKVLGYRKPDDRMAQEYHKALDFEKNPIGKDQVARMLHPGQATKGN